PRSAQSCATASCKPGWLAFSRTSRALPARAALAKVFLAVEGVGGEQDAAQAQPLDQRPGRRDLVALGDLLVGQDQRGLASEGAQPVRGRLVVQVIEAALCRRARPRAAPTPSPSRRPPGPPR